MEYTIHPIAHIRTDFTDKFGIPRQSGLVPELTARIDALYRRVGPESGGESTEITQGPFVLNMSSSTTRVVWRS